METMYALINNNGRYSAVICDKGMDNVLSQIILTASSKKSLKNKIVKEGYDGYLSDGLIRGMNEGERCERHTIIPR